MGKGNFISVIIPTYNRCPDLKKTLDSLLRQKINDDLDFEVIVVDNNSNDQTSEQVRDYIEKFEGKLRYFLEEKQGKLFALNHGIAEAHGNILAFTDDDCIIHEDWIENINKNFIEHNVDMLCGKIIPVFNAPKPKWLDLNVNVFKGPYVCFDLGEQYVDNSVKDILPTGANVILKCNSLQKFGGYTSALRSEDTELGYRWRQQGARIAYAPDVIVYHVTPASRLNKNYVRKWQFLCGKNSTAVFGQEYKIKRRFLGVPLWVYKNAMISISRYFKSAFLLQKDSFVRELWVCFNLGVIWSYLGKKTHFENLR